MRSSGKWIFCGIILSVCLTHSWNAYAQSKEIAQPTSASELDAPKPPADMFVDLVVPTHRVYLGEFIQIQYDVYVAQTRGQVYYDNIEPDFSTWYVYEGKTPNARMTTENGRVYTKEPFAIYFVSPTKVGNLALPHLGVSVPYTDPTTWITHPKHIVEVLPPPQPYPENFDLRNVGDIRLESDIPDERQIQAGQQFKYEISIISNTATASMSFIDPNQSNTDASLKVYAPKKKRSIEKVSDGKYYSETIYEFMYIPLNAGTYDIKPIKIVTFNPAKQAYESIQSTGFRLTATANTAKEVRLNNGSTLILDSKSLEEIKLKRYKSVPLLPFWSLFTPAILFVILYGAKFASILRNKRKHTKDQLDRLTELYEQFSTSTNVVDQFKILRNIMEIHLNQSFTRTSHLDVQQLRNAGLDTHNALALANHFDTLRDAIYSNNAALSPKELEEILEIIKLISVKA